MVEKDGSNQSLLKGLTRWKKFQDRMFPISDSLSRKIMTKWFLICMKSSPATVNGAEILPTTWDV